MTHSTRLSHVCLQGASGCCYRCVCLSKRAGLGTVTHPTRFVTCNMSACRDSVAAAAATAVCVTEQKGRAWHHNTLHVCHMSAGREAVAAAAAAAVCVRARGQGLAP